MTFEGSVPSNRDPNSQAAARQAEAYAPSFRARVWRIIKRSEPVGLACWQVEDIMKAQGSLGLHQSVSATIWWLHNEGWLVRRGSIRSAHTNRTTHVYHAVDPRKAP